eukprot:1233406-Amphidinium_carterae.2
MHSVTMQAAQIVERWGYDEINLNVGCPSDRVCGRGEFGASLMKRPELVRDCVHAMSRRVQIPVTVKTRLGVDDLDTPERLQAALYVTIMLEGHSIQTCIERPARSSLPASSKL